MPRYDIRELNNRAVKASVVLVAQVTAGDLGKPTPCSEWTLGELLAHMTVQHRGFAAAAAGRGADPGVWQAGSPAADPVGGYAEAAGAVLAAFAGEGAADRQFALPEIAVGTTFPGRQAMAFHFVDYVVHGWDVARCLGAGFEPDPEVLAVGLEVARAVPDGPGQARARRRVPAARGRPRSGGALDQIVALLGRSPVWPD